MIRCPRPSPNNIKASAKQVLKFAPAQAQQSVQARQSVRARQLARAQQSVRARQLALADTQ
jgi:hypothetical protein